MDWANIDMVLWGGINTKNATDSSFVKVSKICHDSHDMIQLSQDAQNPHNMLSTRRWRWVTLSPKECFKGLDAERTRALLFELPGGFAEGADYEAAIIEAYRPKLPSWKLIWCFITIPHLHKVVSWTMIHQNTAEPSSLKPLNSFSKTTQLKFRLQFFQMNSQLHPLETFIQQFSIFIWLSMEFHWFTLSSILQVKRLVYHIHQSQSISINSTDFIVSISLTYSLTHLTIH